LSTRDFNSTRGHKVLNDRGVFNFQVKGRNWRGTVTGDNPCGDWDGKNDRTLEKAKGKHRGKGGNFGELLSG